jgi:UDPglucose 6-dehydrogenase
MKLAVVGTGYVGLVSGVCLAAKGHDVTCVDLNPAIVERLNRAEPTIHERGLPELLAEVHGAGNFRATTEIARALDGAEAVLLAVGTPSENGVIDLTYIRAAARDIGSVLRDRAGYLSVIVKSTVVPGTTDTVVRQEIEDASGKVLGQGFGLGMNPEFLREGEAIEDFMEPDRVVLGHEDAQTLDVLRRMYAPWDVDKPEVNTRTAEMIKYANNCLLATQISAVNEIANLAAAVGGIDVMDVMAGVHLDKRWNPILGQGRVRRQPQDPDLPDPRLRLRRFLFPQGRAGPAQPGRTAGPEDGSPERRPVGERPSARPGARYPDPHDGGSGGPRGARPGARLQARDRRRARERLPEDRGRSSAGRRTGHRP